MKSILKKILPKKVIGFLSQVKNGNYNYYFWLFPVKKNKIVICNYYGKGYGDNGKYIINKIIEEKIKVEIIWLVKKELMVAARFPNTVKIVEYGSMRALYELATAKVWIDNSRKTFYPPKRKNQFYIQTWHSPLRLKKIEKDVEEYLPESYIRMAKKDSENCDLMIAGCDFSWDVYRNSFWYDKEILKCGTPRCDVFFNDSLKVKNKVYEHFKISLGVNLIIFAPTFRSNSNIDAYILEFNQILKSSQERFGGDWRLLIRLHPNVSELSSLINYDDIIIDATDYDDMQELLCAADILITDYSSCMFDMAIANKICFLHAHDLDEYLAKERQLYFNLYELPFYFSKTIEELINNILEFNEEQYSDSLQHFFKKIRLYENGTASKEIVEKIKRTVVLEL
ncbi:CDP-glycerol glycerophosphotransferase family protein [Paenibacillus sp. GXUN7292]|uniref:CDP-glycerol glycerophosphotransferase family protein n=1 Tax=Paenibacillus sp. GXUN7292 TaxID=3422499 RepID=UPI003D7F1162